MNTSGWWDAKRGERFFGSEEDVPEPEGLRREITGDPAAVRNKDN